MNRDDEKKQGLNEEANPQEGDLKGGPPEQQQPWPGSDEELRPDADHGEESYVGARKLEGKKALITGGDSGIGRAVALAFAREGADVAIAYLEEHEDAKETVRLIEDAGRKAVAIPGDLQDPGHCRDVVRHAVDGLGGLNIVVNNAAVHEEESDFLKITPEQLDRTFRTNIYAYIWVAQAALEHLGEGDCIINTGSVTALRGHPSLLDYAATKAAIHNFTTSLAQVVAERGIRVNCVAPGPVWTPLIPSTREEEAVGTFGASTFWERPAQPAELAPSYVFLASADSRYYTAAVFSPTGSAFTSR
jgi:NAD(P)-dependent dehydrogenase (short-subunit alcohol dehydrogenase family)